MSPARFALLIVSQGGKGRAALSIELGLVAVEETNNFPAARIDCGHEVGGGVRCAKPWRQSKLSR